jgi:hypothetical protein
MEPTQRREVRLYTESHTAKRIREILNPTNNIVEEDEEDIDFTLFDDTYTLGEDSKGWSVCSIKGNI